MTFWTQFFWGALGSLTWEVINLLGWYRTEEPMPSRFRRKGYWFVRFLLMCLSGFLSIAFNSDSELLSLEIGVLAPWIVKSWVTNMRRTTDTGSDGKAERATSAPNGDSCSRNSEFENGKTVTSDL